MRWWVWLHPFYRWTCWAVGCLRSCPRAPSTRGQAAGWTAEPVVPVLASPLTIHSPRAPCAGGAGKRVDGIPASIFHLEGLFEQCFVLIQGPQLSYLITVSSHSHWRKAKRVFFRIFHRWVNWNTERRPRGQWFSGILNRWTPREPQAETLSSDTLLPPLDRYGPWAGLKLLTIPANVYFLDVWEHVKVHFNTPKITITKAFRTQR